MGTVRGPHQLQHPRPGPYHPESAIQQARGSPADFRRGRRHLQSSRARSVSRCCGKLEYTEQNLPAHRRPHPGGEVAARSARSSGRPAKARRFKQIQTELQHLDTQLSRHQFDVLQVEISERQSAAEKIARRNVETGSKAMFCGARTKSASSRTAV